MTTEELNALIAQAERGDISAMNQLTHIYGESDGYTNIEQAAKWFLALIQKDCDPNSDVYEKTGYNKDLYEKVKNAVLNSVSDSNMSLLSGTSSSSLLGNSIYFTSSNTKSYINQAEETIRLYRIKKEAHLKVLKQRATAGDYGAALEIVFSDPEKAKALLQKLKKTNNL